MSKKPTSSALSPEYVLLGLLAQRPVHGYDLHERIQRDLGQIWQISLSQTYNILKRLEAKGFIIGEGQEQKKAPARRRFRLTPAGRRRFKAWLKTPAEPSARAIRVEFLTRLYFTYAIKPQAASSLIDTQIAATQAGLAHLTEMLATLPPGQTFSRLGLELRLRQLTSMLEWMAECRTILGLNR
jgi:DNA-binding PadR family transcriptional regulator